MAVQAKNYLDFPGLGSYDTKIKAWANSYHQIGIKKILETADGNSIKFYKDPNATLADTADFTIDLGSQDALDQLNALAAKVPGTYDSANKVYSIDGLSNAFPAADTVTLVAAINSLKSEADTNKSAIGTLGSLGTTVKTDLVSAINEVLTNIADLDVAEFPLATVSNNVVTIKGIKENEGLIAVGTDTTNDITFEEVAMTGAAADVSVADAQSKLTATNVEDALTELAIAVETAIAASDVTCETSSPVSGDILRTYSFYQGVLVGDDAATKASKKIIDVNIPRDYLVKAAEVKTVTTPDDPYSGAEVGDKYIDFTVNTVDTAGTETHLYIPVDDLMSAISGSVGAEITVSISATNQISATINKVASSKIIYKEETSSGAGDEVTVEAALDIINGSNTTAGSIAKAQKDAQDYTDSSIAALDTSTDVNVATFTAGSGGNADVITLTGALSETDGIVSGVSTNNITLSTITEAEINSLFT